MVVNTYRQHCNCREDKGCEFTSSCLDCFLPECPHNYPGGKQMWLKYCRGKEALELCITQGKEKIELAPLFGVSGRTIRQILKGTLSNGGTEGSYGYFND